MHCYLVFVDRTGSEGRGTYGVFGTLTEARTFVRSLHKFLRDDACVELRDMPADKDSLLLLLRDRLMGSRNFPDNVGPLLRAWSTTPRGALKEEELS